MPRRKRRPPGLPGAGPAGGRGPGEGSVRVQIALLLLIAVVRMVHLAGILGDPLAEVPRTDAEYHCTWAETIAAGDLTHDGPFFRAPLYPYVLGGLFAISGSSLGFARAVQLALGLVTAWLLMRLGARTLGSRVGLIAGTAYGMYPLVLRTEGDFLLEGLFLFLTLGAMLSYLETLDRPSRVRWFRTGLLFGLAAITRPTVLAFVVVIPLITILVRRLDRVRLPPGRAALEAGLLVLGVLIPILPVTTHNWVVGHDLVPIASQGGVNFYIGNNPAADGFTAKHPDIGYEWIPEATELAEREAGRPLKPSEVSNHYTRKGLDFLIGRPAEAGRLLLRKVYLFWWGAEISNNEHEYFIRRYSWPVRLTLWHAGVYFPFGVLAPLAFLGMALAWMRSRRAALPLIAFVIVYMGTVVLFFVCARFRLPVIPILLLFAAYAGVHWRMLWRGGRRAAGLLAATGLSLVLLNADPYGLHAAVFGSQALSYIDLGLYYAANGEDAQAQAMLEEARKHDPGNPIPCAWLGKYALKEGNLERAEVELRRALRADPVAFRDLVVQAGCDLGRLEMTRGRYREARGLFAEAHARNRDAPQAVAGLGFTSLALGDTLAARGYLERALALDPANDFVQNALRDLGTETP